MWEAVRSSLCEESRRQTLRRASRAQSESQPPRQRPARPGAAHLSQPWPCSPRNAPQWPHHPTVAPGQPGLSSAEGRGRMLASAEMSAFKFPSPSPREEASEQSSELATCARAHVTHGASGFRAEDRCCPLGGRQWDRVSALSPGLRTYLTSSLVSATFGDGGGAGRGGEPSQHRLVGVWGADGWFPQRWGGSPVGDRGAAGHKPEVTVTRHPDTLCRRDPRFGEKS